MTMRRAIGIWLGLSAIGAAVVALPDSGERLFSLSEAHGPSALDAVGIGLLLVGWLVFLTALFGRRERVAARLGHGSAALAIAFSLGLGVGLIVASVAGDFAYWWVAGAALLFAVQLGLAWTAR